MSKFGETVAEQVQRIAKETLGATFWLKKTVTSSAILTTNVAITEASTGGELMIEDIIIKSDSTGLAAGSTFRIVTNNAKGTTGVFMHPVNLLGANRTVDMDNAEEYSVRDVNNRVILEEGKTLSVNCTVTACTGAGTIDIYIKFRKLADNASILAA